MQRGHVFALSWPGDGLQVRSALLPGEPADHLGIDPAIDIPISSPVREGAGSNGSLGASSALNQVNYRREGFVKTKNLAGGRIEFQVGSCPCHVVTLALWKLQLHPTYLDRKQLHV